MFLRFDVKLSFGRQLKRFSLGVFPSLKAVLQPRLCTTSMALENPLHQRRRPLTQPELDAIPWFHLLAPDERDRAASDLKIADAAPGDFVSARRSRARGGVRPVGKVRGIGFQPVGPDQSPFWLSDRLEAYPTCIQRQPTRPVGAWVRGGSNTFIGLPS